ncbi:MAG: hypothetical protein IKV96_03355 [Firmicutes bacterium]|nr:hypothetical protein [Bacillota bacterium]
MFKRFYRTIFTLLGLLCGTGIALLLSNLVDVLPIEKDIPIYVMAIGAAVCVILSGLIFFIIAPSVMRSAEKAAEEIDSTLQKRPLHEVMVSMAGLLIGLVFAFLISNLWAGISENVPTLGLVLSILVYVFFGYIGMYIASRKSGEIAHMLKGAIFTKGVERSQKKKTPKETIAPKILDTSVIIDGRIADIMKTGFIEGKIVIPEFVLVELRHIADSSDALKRNRGRRGLDILNKIQTQYGVEIYNTDNEKSVNPDAEVDVKLLELAAAMKGKVVTNDYNLNKVALIKGVAVLNINELANTLKPVVLPGEEMEVTPIKEGKEYSQALAYLDDGTMIVVEDGRRFINENITVVVTSVLQTSAGRMIFAKPKDRY